MMIGALAAARTHVVTASWAVSANETVSNSYTVTKTGNDGVNSAATLSAQKASGKWYWEIAIGPSSVAGDIGVGLANPSFPLEGADPTFGSFLGANANSWGVYYSTSTTGQDNYNNVVTYMTLPTITPGGRARVALDCDNWKWWISADGGPWNGTIGGTQDPATNQGGLAIPVALRAGGVMPAVSLQSVSGGTIDGAFVSTSWSYAAPTGFGQIAAIGPVGLVGPNVPAGAITIPLNSSIQTAIDNNANNAIFFLPAGTWNNQVFSPKAGNQFWGDRGSGAGGGTILNGTGQQIYTIAAVQGVQMFYLTFQNYGTFIPGSANAIFHAVVNWQFSYCKFLNIGNVAVDCHGANNLIYRCLFSNIGHRAIGGGTGGDSIGNILGNEFTNCNSSNNDPNSDAACMKWTGVTSGLVMGNYCHDNICCAIWMDIECTGVTIDGNTIINSHSVANAVGIFYETCSNGIIRNNVIQHCDGFGIWVSSSGHTEVYQNNVTTMAGSSAAILVLADPNHSQPIPADSGVNNHVHNNTVTFLESSSSVSQVGVNGGTISGDSFTNNNTYFGTATDPHWGFISGNQAFAAYKASTGQDAGSTCTVGSGTVAGCTHLGCTNSGWFG